jgi:hypothetical protein
MRTVKVATLLTFVVLATTQTVSGVVQCESQIELAFTESSKTKK